MKLRIPILLALAGHAFAQDPAPLKLTLRDAVQLALKQNPRVILANLGVAQSEQDRNIARSALLPQVVGHANETVNRLNLESAIGSRSRLPPARRALRVMSSSASISMRLSWI